MDESIVFLLLIILLFIWISSQYKPPIDPLEHKALYDVPTSLNPTFPSTTDYPDDFCRSAPHAVVCESHRQPNQTAQSHIAQLEQKALYDVLTSLNPSFPSTTHHPVDFCLSVPQAVVCESHRQPNQTAKSHIAQLNFGYFPDQNRSLHCSPNATLNSSLFSPFPYLRKISFSNCFNNSHNPLHLTSLPSLPPSLQELVFIQNPSIITPLQPFLRNLTSLKRLVLVGNGFYGDLPPQMSDFQNLEELTLSGNDLSGEVPASIGMLKKLEILDLSHNNFKGCVPEQLGNLVSLVMLNLSGNEFACEIPPSFIHLKNLTYLGLDNNKLEGSVPEEFGFLLKSANEINLENNNLSGTITFTCGGGVGQKKLKLGGNMGLYLEINASCCCENGGSLGHCKAATGNGVSLQHFYPIMVVLVFIIGFVLSYLFLF